MASINKRPSRHLLPLPSLIFNKTRNDLCAAALSPLDEGPDEGLTALPPPAEEPAPGPERPHHAPTKSLWRWTKDWLKKFNCSSTDTQEDPPPKLVIGAPFGFQHVGGLAPGPAGNEYDCLPRDSGSQMRTKYRNGRVGMMESVVSADSAWTDVD